MKKEKIIIEIKCEREKQFNPHYLSATREFVVEAYRGRLFQTLDSIEKKLMNKYPVSQVLPIPNETKLVGPSGNGNNITDSDKK